MHVYNLTAMSSGEAASVVSAIRDRRERQYASIASYKRQDGSLGASTCDPAPAALRGAWQFTIGSLMAHIASCCDASWVLANGLSRNSGRAQAGPARLDAEVITGAMNECPMLYWSWNDSSPVPRSRFIGVRASRGGCCRPAYAYVSSWVDLEFTTCFQLMETERRGTV